ncbi:unnamed protein product [Cylindrotheca closterium]|uniref:Uncharacterized protein n=1 Tax=Cylindrotheca closterium TaxID=2856 RepID=A0AAD2JLI6_9STRA|nr:unnamed protein product [Cylindrotheca closterium]
MVAFIPALALWTVGALIAAQFLKPRLPAYSFGIKSMWPAWGGRAKLGADVWLRNDNYVPIDIYALACDVYYPDWQGGLNHIGHVHDTQKVELEAAALACRGGDANAVNDEECVEPKKQPLWKIQPRSDFEKDDHVYLQPVSIGFGALTSLLYDMFWQYGIVYVPSSMTVQVKANNKIRVTMSILCDNELNVWTLKLVGTTCEIDTLMMGWSDMPGQVERLRTKTIDGHQPHPNIDTRNSSIVGKKPEPPNFHDEYEKAHKKTSWKDVPLFGS